tara:strand:- start:387 stop:935 length:549 start_codon:yes stop_codon:yes gene_type:complete
MKDIKTIDWTIDPIHSLIQFKVKHLAISNVSGNFNDFSGTFITQDEEFNNAKIYFEINTNSVDTNNSERDIHLKSKTFFNIDKFPKIIFNGILQKLEDNFQINGDLTILSITKPIQLQTEFLGIGVGRFNDERAGFEINGKLNRKEYGLNFGLVKDAGSLIVGEEIKLHFDLQLIKQPNLQH